MSSLSIRLLPETLRSLAFGSISAVYAGVGTAILHPARVSYIVNTTDVVLTFSLDGVNDHFVVAPTTSFILDIMANHALTGGACTFAQGTRLYVKGAPSAGSVYFTVFYGSNG